MRQRLLNMSLALALSITFLVIALAMIIVTILYFLLWRPGAPTMSCQSNNNCSIGQVCQAGGCVETLCSNNSECGNNGLCINSYCTTFTCQIGNDCPTGTACINGSCLRVGDPCQNNSDCFDLSCTNQVCIQCLSNSSCPIGQGCFDQICRYPYDGETDTNMITYVSSAQNNGNITAPPGYFCLNTICGTGTNNQDPINCSGGSTGLVDLCPSTCPFCVNSVCRCTQGENTERCRFNSDCESGLCEMTKLGRVCVPIGGECISNHSNMGSEVIDGIGECPISKPYCVNGTCSTVSLGAICGSTGLPEDLCDNPQSLGSVGPTGITPNGMGFFCVNGFCQQNPGELNDLCTHDSCGFIEQGILVCVPVQTPNILQMRCLENYQ